LAGIRHYKENDPNDLTRTEHYASATDALKIFENDSLLFKPGEKFYYSSFGWNLIGAIIENVSREPYLHYMSRHIWKPLEMNHTYGDVADSSMVLKSKFYGPTGKEAPFEDLSYKYSGGGLLSTGQDLVKFGNALLHGNLPYQKQVESLFQTQHTTDGNPSGYGLGWYVGRDKNGHRIWYHAGDLLNSSAYLVIYPDDDLVVAFLANSQQGLLFDIREVGELFYKN
jgi:CubicO group peptidase (beta-lactamase class C family)